MLLSGGSAQVLDDWAYVYVDVKKENVRLALHCGAGTPIGRVWLYRSGDSSAADRCRARWLNVYPGGYLIDAVFTGFVWRMADVHGDQVPQLLSELCAVRSGQIGKAISKQSAQAYVDCSRDPHWRWYDSTSR